MTNESVPIKPLRPYRPRLRKPDALSVVAVPDSPPDETHLPSQDHGERALVPRPETP
jgi:hypothetical protein